MTSKIEDDDEIISVTKTIEYFVETRYSDYRRGKHKDSWEVRMGESWEPVYDSSNLEKMFQEYINL